MLLSSFYYKNAAKLRFFSQLRAKRFAFFVLFRMNWAIWKKYVLSLHL